MFTTLRIHSDVLDDLLTSHVHIHFSSIQTTHCLLFLTKIRCRATDSLSSLEDSPNKLPTLTENLLLCSPALLLTPLLLLDHILDFVLKRIYAFVRIFNTFSIIDELYFQFLQFCVVTRISVLMELVS